VVVTDEIRPGVPENAWGILQRLARAVLKVAPTKESIGPFDIWGQFIEVQRPRDLATGKGDQVFTV
jgi:hypothetical protein